MRFAYISLEHGGPMENTSLISFYRFETKKYFYWLVAWTALGLQNIPSEIKYLELSLLNGQWLQSYLSIYLYASMAPIIVYVCWKWHIDEQNRTKTLFKLTLFYFVFTYLHFMLLFTIRFVLSMNYPLFDFEPSLMLGGYLYFLGTGVANYCIVIVMSYLYLYLQVFQQEKLRLAKLQEQMTAARLKSLENQIQPHFLFNTLNLISSVIYQDVKKADSIISRLGDLLRDTLARSADPLIPLKDEMQTIHGYLEIMQYRFGQRLNVTIDIPVAAEKARIPKLLLLPIVENAIKYAVEPFEKGGSILLKAQVDANSLIIDVIDSGTTDPPDAASLGTGLKNCQERLCAIYSKDYDFELKHRAGCGHLFLRIPFRNEASCE